MRKAAGMEFFGLGIFWATVGLGKEGWHAYHARTLDEFYCAHEEKNGRHGLGGIERSSLSNRISFPESQRCHDY